MPQASYAFAVLLTSACALVLEIVAGRLIAPYVGMSLYTWTAIIAVILAGLSAGHWIGGQLTPNDGDTRTGGRRVAWSLGLAAISTLASLVLIRTVSSNVLQSGLHPIAAIVLLTWALFFFPSLFVGIVSPILTKLAIDDQPDQVGRVIGRMFAMGALGSIIGTLAAGYLFISWIGSIGTVIVIAGIYGLLGAAFAVRNRYLAVWVGVFILPFGATLWWGSNALAYQSPCEVESDYFCIRIDDFSEQSGLPSRLMVLDHLVHSINDRDDPRLLYSPYVHFVDEVTARRFSKKPLESAFFIGGGGYTLPRAWVSAYPNAQLTVAEIDPAVTAAARSRMWLPESTKSLTVLHQDARSALRTLAPTQKFDVIFGDAFHDITVPTHLVTREFHGDVAEHLSDRGFYVVNVVDLGSNPRFLFSLIKTLRLDFKAVEVWKVIDEIDEKGRVTFNVLASNRETGADMISAAFGLVRDWRRWPTDDLMKRLHTAHVPVLTDDFAPVDRLLSGLLLSNVE